MKNPQGHLSAESAQKQLKGFLIAGWIIAIAALFTIASFAIVSVAFGARCILLSWHKANASRPNGTWLKVASIALVALSALEVGLLVAAK